MEKFRGIVWHSDQYTEQMVKVLRYAGLVAVLLVIFYGFLIRVGLLDNTFFHDGAYIVLSLLLLWVGVTQYRNSHPNPHTTLFRLIILHLAAAGYLMLVAGFTSPMMIGWILLLIATYFYFGQRIMYASLILLAIVALGDILLWSSYYASNIISVAMAHAAIVVLIAIVGITIGWLGNVQLYEHKAFRKTRRSEELYKDRIVSLVNSISDAIINVDADGIIRTYNAASLDLFNTNKGLDEQKLDNLLTFQDEDGNNFSLFASVNGVTTPTSREDLSIDLGDYDTMRLAISISPVRTSYGDGRTIQEGYMFILRDITKSKTLEQEKDEFISVVSHELRTPITIAEGTISNALTFHNKDMPPEKVKQSLDQAHQQVVFLAKMVNDLSTLSRAERGVGDVLEAIDIDELLHDLYKKYESQAAEKGLALNLDVHPKIGTFQTSRLYLEEILQNFITNAIKYTKKGSVTVKVRRNPERRSLQQTKHSLYFAVEDTGIGISKSDQASIFKKFYRSEDYRTRETNGTGLGLYVSKKLAEKLGTEIKFTSRLNHGSCFYFVLSEDIDADTAKTTTDNFIN